MRSDARLGTVKFYDPAAGFGFIVGDNGSEIFFDRGSIASRWLPEAGSRVKFIAGWVRSGRSKARDVAVLQSVGSRT